MSPINSSALATLRRALSPSASVHLPSESGYSVKRWALNAEQPAAIVGYPACAEDVVHMLAFTQGKAPYDTQSALPLAIKCSGHCAAASSSCAGGMVIDLNRNIHHIRVDADARLAFIGGGCLWEDVNAATLPQGLACVTGVSPIVGVGGSTLGGGFGWLTGQHGLAIDNLISATVVTSSGEILTASETTNSDLFWAIRGGGGNFGVVTEFVMRLHEQRTDFYSSTLTFAPAILESLVPELNAWLAGRESNENAHLMFALSASGQLEVVLQLAYNGDSVVGAKRFERFIKLGPIANSSAVMPLYMLNHQQDAYIVAGTNRLIHGNFIPSTPSGIPTTLLVEMFEAWSRFTAKNPAAAESAMVLELYHTDKWASVPASATAYANRNPTFNVAYIMTWSDDSFTPSAKEETFGLDQRITRIRNAHFPGQAGAAYTNYLHSASKFTTQQFGENAARLEQIKAKYDPAGVFGKWFVAAKKEEVVTSAVEHVELVCAC